MDEQFNSLSADEQAFFDTQGAAEIKPERPEIVEPAQVDTQQQDDGQQPRDDKGKFVPHGALHAEREEHRKTKGALEEMQRKLAVLDDRWNTLLSANKQPEAQAAEPPKPEEDIFGYLKWIGEKTTSIENERQAQQKQERESREQAEQAREINDYWSASTQSYAAQNPDFPNAANWLSEYRHKQLSALAAVDPRMSTEQGRNAQIDQELTSIIVAAAQQQRNPAELVFELAKSWGYTGSTPEPDAAAAKVGQLEAALKSSQTLTASNGKSGSDPLSVQALVDMPEKEFAAWMAKPENARRYQELMGG